MREHLRQHNGIRGLEILDPGDVERAVRVFDRDGFVDAWRRYDKGRLTRIETDRDGDGRPDMFAYYLAGRVDRIGYDVSGDGKVDQWDHDAARRARQAEQLRAKDKQEAEPKAAAEVL